MAKRKISETESITKKSKIVWKKEQLEQLQQMAADYIQDKKEDMVSVKEFYRHKPKQYFEYIKLNKHN